MRHDALGWLRTAGLTDSPGGQECVSDGFSLGVPPKPPGVHANNRIPKEAAKRHRLVEKDRYYPLGWSQIEGVEPLHASRRHGPAGCRVPWKAAPLIQGPPGSKNLAGDEFSSEKPN